MEIRYIKCKSGSEYYLVNDSWNNSNGWGHKSTLMFNKDYTLEEDKVKYLNRTWECYTYQSVMFRVLEKYEQELLNSYINDYKYRNGIVKFKNGERDKLVDEFYETDNGKDIKEIRNRINERRFD